MSRWDLFCRVVDNYGDIGVCWRLARQLVDEYKLHVRLWVDDLTTFSRLCPSVSPQKTEQVVEGVEVRHWPSRPCTDQSDTISVAAVRQNAGFDHVLPHSGELRLQLDSDIAGCHFPDVTPADVVIEAFACNLPPSYIAAMARRPQAPVWINLEYLTAETWVEGCHLLTSPHSTLTLKKHFFFPGFTTRTGGLLRESDLLSRRESFDAAAQARFWEDLGISPQTADEIRISLFCYDNPALPELLETWSQGSRVVHVLATPGAATKQAAEWFNTEFSPGQMLHKNCLTVHALPFLLQPEYDRLLWACDVNFVRGEDSFVRAQWAQRPFVWQPYPQSESTHLVKLEAFLDRYTADWPQRDAIRDCWHAWNGVGQMAPAWQGFFTHRSLIAQHAKEWAAYLDEAGNLANNLYLFVCGQ